MRGPSAFRTYTTLDFASATELQACALMSGRQSLQGLHNIWREDVSLATY